MAAAVYWHVDKGMTVFSGTTHVENLDRFYALLKDMLLDPGFRADDFTRVRDDAMTFLKVSLREGNDEELGKEFLYNVIYAGHPYAHHNRGTIGALQKLTLDAVRAFYRAHYTRANLTVGLAGGYPNGFSQKVESDFARLPEGTADRKRFEAPKLPAGKHGDNCTRDARRSVRVRQARSRRDVSRSVRRHT